MNSKDNITENEVERYWDGNAEVWTEQVRKGFDKYREVLNNPTFFPFIGDVQGKTLLDAGCGEGVNTRKLAQLGAHVYAVDISEKMIRYAVEKEKSSPLGIRYYHASFLDLSIFGEQTFDMVVSFMALMDSPGYGATLKEFHRILKPGGKLVFSVTHPCFITPGLGWVEEPPGERFKLTVGGYFDKNQYVEQWTFSQSPDAHRLPLFRVPRFPRTLSGFLNPLSANGFSIEAIQEPEPTAETVKKHSWLQRWADCGTPFLHIKAARHVEA